MTGAGLLGSEEISLVDEELVIDSVDEVGTDGFLKVSEGFEVGDLSVAYEIVVEELDTASGPTLELTDSDSDGFCIDASEVDSCDTLVGMFDIERCFDFDEIVAID